MYRESSPPIECAITMAFNEIKYRARLVKDVGRVPPVWGSEGKLSQVLCEFAIEDEEVHETGPQEAFQGRWR